MDSITKKCGKCGQEKNFSDFYRDASEKSGLQSSCKECRKIYKENPDAIKNRAKARYHNNKEAEKERVRKWVSDNKDRRNEYQKEYRKGVVHQKAVERWRNNNPDKSREYNHLRRTRIKGCDGKFTAGEWKEVSDKYENKCLACGRGDIKMTIDHIIPLKLGGKNTIDNIQPLCLSCNSKKGITITDYRNGK